MKKLRLPALKSDSKGGKGYITQKVPTMRFLYVKAMIIVLVLAGLGVGSYAGYKLYKQDTLPASTKANQETAKLNEALLNHNRAQALVDAKKALADEPANLDNILAVAYLTQAQNPNEAKQYFMQAFNEFKQQNNPDVAGKSAGTYWAAAGLARQAGEISQAKQYYQEVMKAANPSNSYEQSLAEQSQAELRRLQ
jgi:hypothetical protein